MSANPRSILWIDAHLEHRSPTMRHLLHALPRLKEEGWEITAWCVRSDAPREDARHVFFPTARWLGPLELLWFTLLVNLYGLWRWLCRRPRPAAIIHATCGTYLGANVTSVHFLNCVWARTQLRSGFSGWRDAARYPLVLLAACVERLQWWSRTVKVQLPVSDSVGDELRRRIRRSVLIETLPNSYDETRFNPAIREQRRDIFREQLGFRPDDAVFIFTSLGHYKRKGFWLALGALIRVRAAPEMSHVKFLIVGGKPASVAALQAQIARRAPDWKQWITFTGQQKEVESYLAAADAFLYPSYFEAFSLAEIEAAAMGVPLLLTRHHGSEMILEDGVNGLWLEFDPDAIAETIRRFLRMEPSAFRRSIGKALTRAEYTDRLLGIYERVYAGGVPA